MTIRVLFVCMGNICRSPIAAAVLRAQGESHAEIVLDIDSAGTHAFHVGQSADKRAARAAARRGYDLSSHQARQVVSEDLERFDYVVAMDLLNLERLSELRSECGGPCRANIGLLMDFAVGSRYREVPDPYYGGSKGFEQVLDLVELGVAGLLDDILAYTNNPVP